jgi:uncharacterized membrane protein YqgA involved in biofilm formation
MKELFKKVFSKEIMKPAIMAIISILVLEFIIFPGLTIDNTILNILSGITGVILGIIILTYVDGKIKDRFEKKEDKLNQESEKTKEDGEIL